MASVTFSERMSGKFYFLADPLKELPIAFEFEAHVRGKTAAVTGRIRAQGVLPFTIGRGNDVWTEVARGTMRTHADATSLRAMVRSLRASPF
jgi:hypothetical protein